jgi:hypothetical protein
VSLVLSSSRSHLILALATISSAWGVKTLIISSSKVFEGPTAALPAAVFLSMVVGALGNFWCLFIFRGLVRACPFLRVRYISCTCPFSSVLSL